jgi:hypothetical protein
MPANPSCAPNLGICDTIRFQISSVPSPFVALGAVVAVPPGFGLSDVPEINPMTNTVLIYDPIGCFFNEPSGQLYTRIGWAKYMQPLPPVMGEPYAGHMYPESVWEVFSLCCATVGC